MNRRDLIAGLMAATAGGALVSPARANLGQKAGAIGLRGSMDASRFGIMPDTFDDQSKAFQQILNRASRENKPVFLPSGNYIVSNIDLPPRTRLIGIAGASRLIYGGGGAMFTATGCETLQFEDLVLDGANRSMGDEFSALLLARACPDIAIENCVFLGSLANGVTLDNCGGSVRDCRISGAGGLAALYSVNATGLAIKDNRIFDCANGGLLVHRWTVGDDNSIVTGNRIERIAAKSGGTGQYGNGINLFRTNGVIVANNHVSDCAFSAIRTNSASNAQINGNTCLRSGETGLYAEFQFEGSSITNNIVDGATNGISIANFNEGGRLAICANNLVRNMKTKGPYPAENAGFGTGIYAEADTSVTGNVVENAPKYGIALGWGPYLRNVVAANNVIRQAGEGIAVSVVRGARSTLITGNMIDGAERGAIVGHEWAKPVTRDLAGGKRQPFPHLQIERNLVS